MLMFLSFWEIIELIFAWYLAGPIIILAILTLAFTYITLSTSLEYIVKKIKRFIFKK